MKAIAVVPGTKNVRSVQRPEPSLKRRSGGVGASLSLLVVILVIGSVIGLFYYLRIIAATCAAPAAEPQAHAGTLCLEGSIVLGSLTALLIVLGVYPAPLIRNLQAAVGGFG